MHQSEIGNPSPSSRNVYFTRDKNVNGHAPVKAKLTPNLSFIFKGVALPQVNDHRGLPSIV